MREIILAAALTLVVSGSALAQTVEVFGGYSYTSTDFNIGGPAVPGGVRTVNVRSGWTVGGAIRILEDVSLVAKFSRHTGSEDLGGALEGTARFQSTLFGPRLLDRRGILEYWVSGLIGSMQTELNTGSEIENASSLAVGLGGGLDLVFGRIGVRAVEFEAVFGSALLSNPAPRISVGAFYRF